MTALAWGLFCRDLEPRGYGYAEAASYWILEGRPARMDADRNGIPCETVYPASEVEAYWGSPLPTSSPGPGPGWSASTYEPAASPGCCDANPSAPPSPPLPPETGPFPDDGVYHVQIHRVKGEHAELLVTIRRWVPCSQLPEECYSYSDTEGDATVDRSSSVVRSIPLNEDLAVVINGIPVHGPGTWEVRRIAGDGVALSRLLERLDAAYDHVVRPRYDPETPLWDVESRLASWGDRDPTLPFGAELWDESGGFFHYRGPAETPLTCSFYSVWPGSEAERVDWMYGWWPSLEIVDGSPILYLEAGQIAG